MSDRLAIEVQGLCKRHRGSDGGIFDISWQVGGDEGWLLAGPNGAGKTTLLHCLMGLLTADAGQVRVLGGPPRQARAQLGHQAEIFAAPAQLTGRQLMQIMGRLGGCPAASLEADGERLLRRLELWEVRDRRIGTYSKGMLQRLGVAQSLLGGPQLLLWDEPVSGLDPRARRLVLDLAQEHRAAGRPLVVCTHLLADMAGLCDHLAIVVGGRLRLAGAVGQLLATGGHADLEALYLAHSGPQAAAAVGR